MEKITEILNNVDFTKLVPELDQLLEKLQLIPPALILIGPLILLVLGLIYLLLPPKEANHRLGFRTYFGMGSIEAWRFTQKLAGSVMSAAGLVLTVVMAVIRSNMAEKTMDERIDIATRCLLWELGVALVAYFAISLTAAILFNAQGKRRWGKI